MMSLSGWPPRSTGTKDSPKEETVMAATCFASSSFLTQSEITKNTLSRSASAFRFTSPGFVGYSR